MLRLYNTQSRSKEEFKPLDPAGRRVAIYACGPTVYDSPHLGHARAAIVPDLIRRYLEYRGFLVRYATNFTDVDDKILKRAFKERRSWREITGEYLDEFQQVMTALNVRTADVYPRATGHVTEMVRIVERLIKNGHAYVARDGDVYFNTRSHDRYGSLSGRRAEEEETGLSGRVAQERLAVKLHPGDFVLWKLDRNDRDELAEMGEAKPRWPSPWGEGRPGWHLECSAMSAQYLGLPFDIHCGGMDLIFPHHEDEKAQTECAFHQELAGGDAVRYWIHNAFVVVKRRPEDQNVAPEYVDPETGHVKLSKSLLNADSVRQVIQPEGPYDPMAVRMMILSCHYRSPLVFEPALLDEAQARLDRFYNTLENLDRATAEYAATRPTGSWRIEIVQLLHLPTDQTARIPLLKAVERAKEQFEAAMDDDFNSAGALAALFDYLTSINQELAKRPKAEKASPSEMLGFGLAAVQLRRLMAVLGLRGSRGKGGGSAESEKLLDLLLQLRQAARRLRRFDLADQVRDQLKALGYEIEDLPNDKWAVKKH